MTLPPTLLATFQKMDSSKGQSDGNLKGAAPQRLDRGPSVLTNRKPALGFQATKSAAKRKSIPLCLIELADGIRRVERLKHGIACHEHVGSCFFEV